MRTGKFDDVKKFGNMTFVLKRIKCTWGNGTTYQTRVYEGNRLVDMNEYVENYGEAFRYYCSIICDVYGFDF